MDGALVSLVAPLLAISGGPCSVNGTWNALGFGTGAGKLVAITQASRSQNVTASWWLPNPSTRVEGTFDGVTLQLNNGLKATASASAIHPNGTTGQPCTLLSFASARAQWCLEGYCSPEPAPSPATPTPPSPPTPNDPETSMPMFEVADAAAAGALYPNGQPAYYYMNYTGSSSWIIHLSGGGWRFMTQSSLGSDESQSPPTQESMTSDGTLGAENNLGHCYGKCDGILSDDPEVNPEFHNWNKIWIPISGTSFTGDRQSDKPYPVRGKRIQTVVVNDLLEVHGMSTAENVILTGGSSGGLATYLTCDRVGEQVRSANSSTRYTCLADAGFFLHHNSIDGQNSTAMSFKESYYAWNSSSGTNQACVAALRPTNEDWKCIFAEHVAPFIKSEIYVMQNLYDSWQVNNILKIGCSGYNKPLTDCTSAQMSALEQYGSDMRASLKPLIENESVGIFAPSCIAHCQSVENEHPIALWFWPSRWSIVEDSTSLYPRDSFTSWYFRRVTGNSSKHVQQCPWSPTECNKLCPMWT